MAGFLPNDIGVVKQQEPNGKESEDILLFKLYLIESEKDQQILDTSKVDDGALNAPVPHGPLKAKLLSCVWIVSRRVTI